MEATYLIDFYTELKSWQSGIAALLGFFALFFGALYNFHLNRVRDVALRKEEILSIAIAIYSEILIFRDAAAKIARIVANRKTNGADFDDQFVEDFRLREPRIYFELASKLGFLPPDVLIPITRFYGNYHEVKENMKLLVERERTFSRGTVHTSSFGASVVLEPALKSIEEAEKALKKIEDLACLAPSQPPNTGNAQDVLEIEQGI